MAVYPNLFKPIKIGTMEVKNRLFLAPMGYRLWRALGSQAHG